MIYVTNSSIAKDHTPAEIAEIFLHRAPLKIATDRTNKFLNENGFKQIDTKPFNWIDEVITVKK